MNRAMATDSLKEEIVKCWDDGEIATYDRLLKLCQRCGVNTATEVWFRFVIHRSTDGQLSWLCSAIPTVM